MDPWFFRVIQLSKFKQLASFALEPEFSNSEAHALTYLKLFPNLRRGAFFCWGNRKWCGESSKGKKEYLNSQLVQS